jgi:16S rRNA U1498 N3-methylase RsmE
MVRFHTGLELLLLLSGMGCCWMVAPVSGFYVAVVRQSSSWIRSRPTFLKKASSNSRPASRRFISSDAAADNVEVVVHQQPDFVDSWYKLPRLHIGPIATQAIPLDNDWDLLANPHRLLVATAAASQQQQQHSPWTVGSIIPLSLDQTHYVTSVLRLTKKRSNAATHPLVRLWDATRGEEWVAELQVLSSSSSERKRRATEAVVVTAMCRYKLRSRRSVFASDDDDDDDCTQEHEPMHCWLCVALPKKKERLRWLIEKCTEVDGTGFLLLDTDYSETAMEQDKDRRYGSVSTKTTTLGKLPLYAVEASEQCERLTLPHFVTVMPTTSTATPHGTTIDLSYFLRQWSSQSEATRIKLLACRERSVTGSVPVWSALEGIFSTPPTMETGSVANGCGTAMATTTVAFLVGPEGGWSPAEQELLNQLALRFPRAFYNVSLGRTILRSETAAVAALSSFALFRDYYTGTHKRRANFESKT